MTKKEFFQMTTKERKIAQAEAIKERDERRVKRAKVRAKALKDAEIKKRNKSVVLKQPKTPKSKPKPKRKPKSALSKRIDRDIAGLQKSGAELKKLGEKAKKLVSKKEDEILGTGIVWIDRADKGRIVKAMIRAQGNNLSGGRLKLSFSQIGVNKSLAMISRGKVTAILSYTKGDKVKINQVASSSKGAGAKLVRALFKKFSGKQFILDSVPGAVPFWRDTMDFKVVGDVGTGNNLTEMIK